MQQQRKQILASARATFVGVFGLVSAHNGPRSVGVVSAECTQDAPWIPQELREELPPAAWVLGLTHSHLLATCFGQEVAGQRCCARLRPKEAAAKGTQTGMMSPGPLCPASLPPPVQAE